MGLKTVLFCCALAVLSGCEGSSSPDPPAPVQFLPTAPLADIDVQTIIDRAVTRAANDQRNVVVAVSDREGNVLGVFTMTGAPTNSPFADQKNQTTIGIAIEKARTTAFLSSDQDAFSTRTGAFIVNQHFPPGVRNTANGPLFGLPFSSLSCSDVQLRANQPPPPPPPTGPPVTVHGNGITGAVGGIPLYFNGQIAGGIGVDGTGSDEDEVIALAGASGIYAPPDAITGDKIDVNGIQLVFIGVPIPAPLTPIPFTSLPNFGSFAPGFGVIGTPPTNYPAAVFAGVPGEIRFTIRDSPLPGPVKLTATDVVAMITNAVAEARITRAAIRQPIGVPARMQVGVTDTAGNILGVFRMNDATMFSLDIVIQKGRSVTAFSDPTQPLGQLIRSDLGLDPNSQVAFTTRTLGFLAQPFYPPGIDESQPGPLFQIQEQLFAGPNPCAPYMPGNGVTLFPGSVPLYKSGILVGGLGISGDGVDQDDFVTFSGATGFLPDFSIRADNIIFRGTNLPFLKFPRHPTL